MSKKPIFEDTGKIVDAAFEIISNEGFKNFSTRKLSSELGVSKNAVFNYIKTKEDILRLVVEKFNTILVEKVIGLIDTEKEYYKNNLFDIYLIFTDVLYDLILNYGDVYKLAIREFNKTFEPDVPFQKKFPVALPVLDYLFDDFNYSDFKEFTEEDFLDKHYLLTVLMLNMSTIELNRKEKIGKEKHNRLFLKAFKLITDTK